MPDKRFFKNKGPFSVEEIAKLTNCDIYPETAKDKQVLDIAGLDNATETDISFLDNKDYVPTEYFTNFKKSKAGFCIINPKYKDDAPENMVLLLNEDPYNVYADVTKLFYKQEITKNIHKSAVIDKTAKIGKNCNINANAVIGANVEIGDNCIIEANSTIADNVIIGNNCKIGANASLTHTIIGNNCHIYTGVRIGQNGFGFAMTSKGHNRIEQLGRVIIEDNVEIGANTTIDRGSGPDTIIKAGVMIDNLVQIAHNVEVGNASVIVAQAGISGSTKMGKFSILAGQSGIAGHLNIGDNVRIAAKSGVIGDIPSNTDVAGFPSVPRRQFFKQIAVLHRLANKKKK